MMNRISIIIIIAMAHLTTNAQKQHSCHAATDFASFAKEESFRAGHQAPPAYQYTGAGEMITFTATDDKPAKAFLIKAAKPTNNYLFVFHEWWGLTDLVKKQSERFQKDLGDINVLAIDLYEGKTTADRDEAAKLMGAMDEHRAVAIIQGAAKYVGKDARIYTVGWCLGGGWSLQASLIAGKQAAGCVIYYGMPEESVAKLKTLNSDVLFILAAKDQWITPELVKTFEENMKAANKKIEVVSFDADHAFANPSNAIYDQEATEKAYQKAFEFLKARL